MAATTYQIMYRSTNDNVNVMITNPHDEDLEQYTELYHNQHKIAIGSPEEKMQATNKRDSLLVAGNTPECPKFRGLYEYTGARRFNRRNWIHGYDGYVIRDWQAVADQITNTNYGSEDGDYTGKYLLFEGDTPQNGIVVAKKSPIDEKYGRDGYVILNNDNAPNGIYYDNAEQIKEELKNATIAEIDFTGSKFGIDAGCILGPSKADPPFFVTKIVNNKDGKPTIAANLSVKIGGDRTFIPSMGVRLSDGADPTQFYSVMKYDNWSNEITSGKLFCTKVQLLTDHLKKYPIPGHWESTTNPVYYIQDTYKKLSQEPWFIYSTEHSLTQALDKCRNLVEKIGIENVKLIKVVPTDQFLRIR